MYASLRLLNETKFTGSYFPTSGYLKLLSESLQAGCGSARFLSPENESLSGAVLQLGRLMPPSCSDIRPLMPFILPRSFPCVKLWEKIESLSAYASNEYCILTPTHTSSWAHHMRYFFLLTGSQLLSSWSLEVDGCSKSWVWVYSVCPFHVLLFLCRLSQSISPLFLGRAVGLFREEVCSTTVRESASLPSFLLRIPSSGIFFSELADKIE